ncbi:MAG: dicarboxylate/amino acid:cation symporter [Pseudomonadota bacterium]
MSVQVTLYWVILASAFAGLYWLARGGKTLLWQRVMIALVGGVVVGFAFGDLAIASKWIGDIFVNLIRMIVVPLIFTTIVAGVISMGDPKRLGGIGAKAIGLYMLTTLGAIIVGLTFGVIFEPGAGVDISGAVPKTLAEAAPIGERLINIVPRNPVAALANGDVLSIIFFSLILGVAIVLTGEKAKPLGDVIEAAAETVLKVATIVMEFAPFGVFALVAWVAGTLGIDALRQLLVLTLVVYGACVVHMLLVYGGLIRGILGLPLVRFFRGMLDAQAVAYSTSSSSATLPITINCVERNLGVKNTVASSILPLGSTINMDGTALYQGIIATFAAQVFGIDLAFTDYLLIALTVTLVSIGTAGVPSASLFLAATVLSTFGVTDAQTALIVGFILPFDRILDMARTVVNITGDAAVAVTVAKSEGELDEESFRAVAVV